MPKAIRKEPPSNTFTSGTPGRGKRSISANNSKRLSDLFSRPTICAGGLAYLLSAYRLDLQSLSATDKGLDPTGIRLRQNSRRNPWSTSTTAPQERSRKGNQRAFKVQLTMPQNEAQHDYQLRILVVEDEECVRDLLRDLLESEWLRGFDHCQRT